MVLQESVGLQLINLHREYSYLLGHSWWFYRKVSGYSWLIYAESVVTCWATADGFTPKRRVTAD